MRKFAFRDARLLRIAIALVALATLALGACVSDTHTSGENTAAVEQAASVGGSCAPSGSLSQVTPGVACILKMPDGSSRAILSYTSVATQVVSAPVGPLNFLATPTTGILPPTTFQPGTHVTDVVVPVASSALPWTLGAKTATGASAPACNASGVGTVNTDASGNPTSWTAASGTTVLLDGAMDIAVEGSIFATQTASDGFASGALHGDFQVNDSGQVNYTLPIDIPPARIQPHLALAYNSGAGESVVGVGWSLSGASTIVRCAQSIAIDGVASGVSFTNSDALCLDGQRLIPIDTASPHMEFRTRTESFTQVLVDGYDSAGPLSFTIHRPDRTIARYGLSTAERYEWIRGIDTSGFNQLQVSQAQAPARYGWLLTTESDRFGNTVRYTWDSPTQTCGASTNCSERVLRQIDYASNAIVAPTKRLAFLYQPSAWPANKYVSGFALTRSSRLAQVVVSGPMPRSLGLVRTYDLAYQPIVASSTPASDARARDILTSVTECDANNTCLPPTTFDWQLPTNSYHQQLTGVSDAVRWDELCWMPSEFDGSCAHPMGSDWQVVPVDLNRDGMDDILYRSVSYTGSGDYQYFGDWFYRLSTGASFGPPHTAGLPEQTSIAVGTAGGVWEYESSGQAKVVQLLPKIVVGTLGGSGYPDVFFPVLAITTDGGLAPSGYYPKFPVEYQRYTFNASTGLFVVQGEGVFYTGIYDAPPVIADVNGDRLPDLIVALAGYPNGFIEGGPETLPIALNEPENPGTITFINQPTQSQSLTASTLYPNHRPNTWTGTVRQPLVAAMDGSGSVSLLFQPIPRTTTDTVDSSRFVEASFQQAGASGTLTTAMYPTNVYGGNFTFDYNYIVQHEVRFVDINGDGLSDALNWIPGYFYPTVAFNDGTSFTIPVRMPWDTDPASKDPTGAPRVFDGNHSTRVADVDGDGLADLVFVSTAGFPMVSLSRGTTFAAPAKMKVPVGAGIPMGPGVGAIPALRDSSGFIEYDGSNGEYPASQILDVNGDGLPDFIQAEGTPGSLSLTLYIHDGQKNAAITTIHEGRSTNQRIFTATYGKLHRDTSPAGLCASEYPISCAPPDGWIVMSYSAYGTGISPISVSRQYIGPKTDVHGDGWLGFDTVIDTYKSNSVVDRRDYNPAVQYGGAYPDRPYLLTETRTVQVGQTDSIVRTDNYTYGWVFPSVGPPIIVPEFLDDPTPRLPQVQLGSVITSVVEQQLGKAPQQLYGSYRSIDSLDTFGNILQEHTALGWPNTVETLTYVATYNNDATQWILGQRLTAMVTSVTSSGLTTTRQLAFTNNATTGALISSTREPTGTSDVQRTSTLYRNTYGQVISGQISDTVGNVRTTSIQYDDVDSTFPVRQVDAAGHATTSWRHPSLGVVVRAVDMNGATASFQYDGFGRIRYAVSSGGMSTTTNYTVDPTTGFDATTVAGGDGSSSTTLTDAFGRERQTKTLAFDGVSYSLTETTYDARFPAKPNYRSEPHFASVSIPTATHYYYDALARPTQVALDGRGTSTALYAGNTTTYTDFQGHVSSTVTDIAARLLSSSEIVTSVSAPTGHPIVRNFAYGPFGGMTSSSSLGYSNLRTFDTVGRISTVLDPDAGATSFKYNAFDEVVHIVSGDASTIDIARDALGREVARTSSVDGVSCRLWDTAPNGVGSLATVTSADGITQSYFYDTFGRRINRSWSVGSESFLDATGYDWLGRLSTVDYPVAADAIPLRATYHYGVNGSLSSVTATSASTTYVVPTMSISASTRNAAGAVTLTQAGTSVSSSRVFDDWGSELHSTVRASGVAAALEEHNFVYDNDALLKERDDLTPGASSMGPLAETFQHDSLHRLLSWSTAGTNVAYSYDDFGNMLSRNGGTAAAPETWTPSVGKTPHQIAAASDGGSYRYDLRGNMTGNGDWSATYNAAGLPRTISLNQVPGGASCSGSSCPQGQFLYDVFGHRVSKQLSWSQSFGSGTISESTKSINLDGLYERRQLMAGPFETEMHIYHVPGLGGVSAELVFETNNLATSSSIQASYRFSDHVGSPTLQVDSSGNVLARQKFDPFGRRIAWNNVQTPTPMATSVPVIPSFTGQDPDDDIGLVNMQGRLYDPKRARFTSPDPLMGNPLLSQRWNKYAYVMNSPLAMIDPSGCDPSTYNVGISNMVVPSTPVGPEDLTTPDGCTPGTCTSVPTPGGGPDTTIILPTPLDQSNNPSNPTSILSYATSGIHGESTLFDLIRNMFGGPSSDENGGSYGPPTPAGPPVDPEYANSWDRWFTVKGEDFAWWLGKQSAMLGLTAAGGPLLKGAAGLVGEAVGAMAGTAAPALATAEGIAIDGAAAMAEATVEGGGAAASTAAEGFSAAEQSTVDLLREEGAEVTKNALEGVKGAGRQGDAIVNGIKTELKSLSPGATSGTIKNVVSSSIKGGGQARQIIIDARNSGLSYDAAVQGANRAAGIARGMLDNIRIIGDTFDIFRGF